MILCLNIEVLYDPENRCRRRLKRLRIVGESALWRGVIRKATPVAAPDELLKAMTHS
jgi:hypothetical protein